LAVGFGAKGFRVSRPDDFGEIDKALAVEDGPVIVNVRINGDVELARELGDCAASRNDRLGTIPKT